MIEKPLKIVFLDFVLELNKPGRSGLSDIVWDMAVELVEMGHDVHVVAPYHQHIAPDQRVKVHTIKVPPKGYRWFVGHLWISKRLADVAVKLQADIIHAPEYVSIAVYNTLYPSVETRKVLTVPGNIFHRLGIKKPLSSNKDPARVLTVPGNIFHKLKARKGNPYAFFYTQCLKWAARKVATSNTNVIAISQVMKQAWEETGSPSNKTQLIPYGTNPRRFHTIPDARLRLGISKDTILLLYVGRFSREKAVVELVETVAQSQQIFRAKKVMVQLFGKGPQTSLVSQKILELGVTDLVIQTEWLAQADLPLWYSAADALLLPSFTEGFARVIPEAMICGTPIIGSRITGTEDHVIPDKTGFLFECGDFQEFGRILEDIAFDPELVRNMRPFAQAYAENNLTWPKIVEKIVQEVYLPHL